MRMRNEDVIKREQALNFNPDPEEKWMSELEQYKSYISDIPKYRPPTTTLEPAFYSTFNGSKEAYKCTKCQILIPKQYAKDYNYCPGCGLKIVLGLNRNA